MKKLTMFLMLFLAVFTFSQDLKFTSAQIKTKLDSIKTEGNLLYALEKASWHAGDLVQSDKALRTKVGRYITYKEGEMVKTVFLNKEGSQIIAEYLFKNHSEKPFKQKISVREMLPIEAQLKKIREEVVPQLSDPKYEIQMVNGFSLNMVIIPFGDQYKIYMIPGAQESGVIPFGNDYLFISDNDGKIISHQKFHSRLIPTRTDMANGTVTMATHSHLRTVPFISATDICTFKLYAPYSTLQKFSVYSPALDRYFEYDLKSDTLTDLKTEK